MRLRLDKSRIPVDKQNDARLLRSEALLLLDMEDEQHRLRVCIHEAAHAIYMERAGLVPVLHGPTAYYNPTTDTFDFGEAAVHGKGGNGVTLDSLVMARWFVAGGVVSSLLIGEGVILPGDGQDFEVFTSELAKLGAGTETISQHWEQAKKDVEKDMRSPAFRREVWDRARDLEKQLQTMFY